jgi:hypothetical protein
MPFRRTGKFPRAERSANVAAPAGSASAGNNIPRVAIAISTGPYRLFQPVSRARHPDVPGGLRQAEQQAVAGDRQAHLSRAT